MRGTRGRAGVSVAVCLGLVFGVASVSAAGQEKKQPAFPDGSWQGTTTSAFGTITMGDIYGAAEAEVNFEFVVEDGGVIEGRMGSQGSSASNVPGGTANQTFSGTFDLAGTAEEVTFEGVTSFSGTVTVAGMTVPYGGEGPGTGSFLPKTATCSKVTGDFSIRGREVQEASGFATTGTAPYVALRVKGADADRVLAEFDALAEQINAVLATASVSDPQQVVDQLFALVDEAAVILNSVRKLKACGAIPPGFKEGLADGYFAEVFTQLVNALLARRDSLSTAQLLSVLGVAYEMGVVGPSAPDKASADDILNQFADALSGRVDDALAEGDIETLTAILAAAEQLGLKDLAAKADKAIDEFLEDQKAGLRATPAAGGGGGERGLTELPGIDEKVQLTAPAEDGGGKVPTFKWKPVDGAAAYRLAVVNDNGRGYWAYQGPKTSIVLGLMKNRPPEGEAGPIITGGSRWSVVALDADGNVIAASEFRDVSP